MRYILSSMVLVAGVTLGCFSAFKSWNGTFFVSNSKFITIRNPANVQNVDEFSKLNGKVWTLLSKERVLTEAAPVYENSRAGFVLGHFIAQDTEGKKLFACDLYNRVQLQFIAEGVAESGVATTMNVEAPCRATSDLNKMMPIWIPHAEILKQQTAPSLDLDFPADDLHISFTHLSTDWPKQWVLTQVRLVQDADQVPSLKFNAEQITRTAKRPMQLNW